MEISKVVEELAYVTLDPSVPVAHRALWAGVRYLVERERAGELASGESVKGCRRFDTMEAARKVCKVGDRVVSCARGFCLYHKGGD